MSVMCMEALVDLCSEVTLIRQADFAKLGFNRDGIPTMLKGFGNHLKKSRGPVKLDISIDGVSAVVL